MRHSPLTFLFAVLLLAATVTPAAAQVSSTFRVSVLVDRPEGLYQCGENARFTSTIRRGAEPVATGEVVFRFMASDGGADRCHLQTRERICSVQRHSWPQTDVPRPAKFPCSLTGIRQVRSAMGYRPIGLG